MYRIVSFEDDEAAELAAREIGALSDFLDGQAELEVALAGAHLEFCIDESDGWSLYSDVDPGNTVAILGATCPSSDFVRLLVQSQGLLASLSRPALADAARS